MTNDFSNNLEKHKTRFDNFALAKQGAPILWSKHLNHFRVDWLELCGQQAPTYSLIKPHLGNHTFIGVDTDPQAITSSQALGNENALWITANLFDLIKNRDERIQQVGVLNYDSFEGVGERNEESLSYLIDFAKRQTEKLSAFLLILNFANPRKVKVEKSAKKLAEMLVSQTRQDWTAKDVLRYKYVSRAVVMFNIPIKFGFLHQKIAE